MDENVSPTEGVTLQDTLESKKNKYKSIVENMADAYFELDLSGRFTFFNRAALKMLGYTAQEMIHMSYRQYVSQETEDVLFNIFNEVYRKGNPEKTIDYEVIAKDGSRKVRETSVSLIRDLTDKPVGFRCLTRDVTERKLAEEALKQRDEDLVIKSQFLAESNAALKVLLKTRESDKRELERSMMSNVAKLILPYIEELKKTQLAAKQQICVETIENNLEDIMSPFLYNVTLKQFNFTPKEMEVASLVKLGKTAKEISTLLNVSTGAINFHKNNIRKKLGLNKKKINLMSCLNSMPS